MSAQISDSEAPFFKAADYGVVGDAFEVVPKFIEKLNTCSRSANRKIVAKMMEMKSLPIIVLK